MAPSLNRMIRREHTEDFFWYSIVCVHRYSGWGNQASHPVKRGVPSIQLQWAWSKKTRLMSHISSRYSDGAVNYRLEGWSVWQVLCTGCSVCLRLLQEACEVMKWKLPLNSHHHVTVAGEVKTRNRSRFWNNLFFCRTTTAAGASHWEWDSPPYGAVTTLMGDLCFRQTVLLRCSWNNLHNCSVWPYCCVMDFESWRGAGEDSAELEDKMSSVGTGKSEIVQERWHMCRQLLSAVQLIGEGPL